MTNLAFDTHSAVKELQKAGMPVKQAESVVATLRKSREFDVSYLATKMDLSRTKSELKADIVASETRLDKKIDGLEASTKINMATLENRLTIKLGGMLVAGIVVVAALVKLL